MIFDIKLRAESVFIACVEQFTVQKGLYLCKYTYITTVHAPKISVLRVPGKYKKKLFTTSNSSGFIFGSLVVPY